MIITPFVPLVPYIAVAEPSFKTSIELMSSGATVLRLPGTPLTKTKGPVPPVIEEIPLNLI
ncbi:hypothetical protein D3C84_1082670 [compost metagenome]